MIESGYYPPGAEFDPDAQMNQEELPEKEIEVTVSVTLSKTVKVLVDDYEVEEGADEDGKYLSYDFSNCDLRKAVEEQVVLPQNLAEFTKNIFKNCASLETVGMPRHLKNAIEDCEGWCVDDLEVIEE